MAAVVEIDESNGDPEVVTHGVASLAMGMADETGMAPGIGSGKQPRGSSSMQKSLRGHLTSLGGSTAVTAFRAYCDPSVAGWTLWTNASTDAGDYDAAKETAYVVNAITEDAVPYALPTADPGDPNLGIGGDLEGELTAPGSTDYLKLQLRSAVDVAAGFTDPFFLVYEEVG